MIKHSRLFMLLDQTVYMLKCNKTILFFNSDHYLFCAVQIDGISVQCTRSCCIYRKYPRKRFYGKQFQDIHSSRAS